MINYKRYQLTNGLRVIIHEDKSTPLAAINIVYDVGSKDEHVKRTGLAHLFEHLMFSGSENVPDFDEPIQKAGGENNAFTNSDLTNFYTMLPAENIETGLWLEADRMNSLIISQESLDVQKKVVVEEFKETCLNKPYGDVWHQLSAMAYKKHAYGWPTIGLIPEHIEEVSLDEIKSFFFTHYRPDNAAIVITGNIDADNTMRLVEKHFGKIEPGNKPKRSLTKEPEQKIYREEKVNAKVPVDAFYMAFHMADRLHQDYYAADLLSDILCNGRSSRLYQSVIKEKGIASYVDSYITGSFDPGLLLIESKPINGHTIEETIGEVWSELDKIKKGEVHVHELEKYKNKVESSFIFSEMSIVNKAINLAYFEIIGDVDLINSEIKKYEKVTVDDIVDLTSRMCIEENCCMLKYLGMKNE